MATELFSCINNCRNILWRISGEKLITSKAMNYLCGGFTFKTLNNWYFQASPHWTALKASAVLDLIIVEVSRTEMRHPLIERPFSWDKGSDRTEQRRYDLSADTAGFPELFSIFGPHSSLYWVNYDKYFFSWWRHCLHCRILLWSKVSTIFDTHSFQNNYYSMNDISSLIINIFVSAAGGTGQSATDLSLSPPVNGHFR